MRFNHFFANHFAGCRLLVTGRDKHRDREVKVYALPGEFDIVGITDTIDAWIAPANALNSPLIQTAAAQLAKIRAGEDPRAMTARVALIPDVVVTTPSKTTQPSAPNTTIRRRLLDV